MSIYQTIVCDRCGAEKKRDGSDSWTGWHQNAEVELDGITRLYSGLPDFTWKGTLCTNCAGIVDAGVRALFGEIAFDHEPAETTTKTSA